MISSTSFGATCPEVLKACDEALNACDQALADSQEMLNRQSELSSLLERRLKDSYIKIQDLEDAQKAWYRNPFLMTGLGIIVGGAGVLLIKR